ncbi:MAG: OB-fold domain-containing protein [Hyphomonadaceae bacterium]|nr:OB-fold domain-containing protein [Hyphomonadaceae bacterium]
MWAPSDPPYRQATATGARAWRGRLARYAMVGGHCGECQAYMFPPRRVCPNCRSQAISQRAFSGRGVLLVAAEDHSPLMGHGGRSKRPFGMVRLEEGPTIMAELVDVEFNAVTEGMPVEMVVRQWRREQSGMPQYGFKFRPVR